MSYYLKTRVSPHGQPAVVGGQSTDGAPLVQYATRDEASAAVCAVRRAMAEPATDTAGRAKIVEVNVCRVDDLRIPGRDAYMILA